MRKQLELDGIPKKRVPLIPEPATRSVEGAGEEGETTEWFPDTMNPPSNGYWDVREVFDVEGKIVRHFYDGSTDQWPAFLDNCAKFQWRGLKSPAPGGYPYDLQGSPRRKRAILSS